MAEKTEKFVNELPSRLIAYDYDNPSQPFTPEQIAYIECIRAQESPRSHSPGTECLTQPRG